MKIKTILTILFISLFVVGNSQVKPFRFGVKVAPDLAWLAPDTKGYENDGTNFGFSWGFMADIALTENYFVKSGFSLDYLSSRLKYPHQMEIEEDTETGILYRKYKLRYLEIPATLKMRTNKFGNAAYFGEIGFGANLNLRAKSEDEFSYDNGQSVLESDEDIKDDITFIYGSLVVGAGMEYFIDESTSLLLSLNFKNGLSDILKGTNAIDPELKQKAVLYYFQLNVGVMF